MRFWTYYTGGEELFGLPITSYAELHEIRKQLALLQKLYGLYNNVISTVNGYYDLLWVDVNIEKINEELYEFQNRFILTWILLHESSPSKKCVQYKVP